MFTEYHELAYFWSSANRSVPILIVGGGRWAKVWASVILAARGSTEQIFMVGRTDLVAVREWAKSHREFSKVSVYSSINEAVEKNPQIKAAIVCSRPRNHLIDTMNALEHKLHVLVEKPISIDSAGGELMMAKALDVQRILLAGTEFSYLPVLHQYAKNLAQHDDKEINVFLRWNDPVEEFLHGSIKARHDEINLLTDLLPHAFSIFSVLAPRKELCIFSAFQSECGKKGHIEFHDESGGMYKLICDAAASKRQRLIEISTRSMIASIDFSAKIPFIKNNNYLATLDPSLNHMTSTLRLELGAFLSAIEKHGEKIKMLSQVQELVAIQRQLERFFPA